MFGIQSFPFGTAFLSEAMLVSGMVNRESLGLQRLKSQLKPMELAVEAACFLRSIPQVVPPPGQVGS